MLGGPVLVQAQAEELVALRVLELLQVARAGGAARRRGDLLWLVLVELPDHRRASGLILWTLM